MDDNKPNWRDHIAVHPAAEMFPPMSEAELKELGEDIKKNRLTHRIVLWRDQETLEDFVLDGRNRLDAMDRIGLVIDINKHFEWQISTKTDPYEYVISANIHRRHLTAEQKRELIAKLMKAQPEKSDRQIAKQTKASPTTVGTVRSKMEKAGDVSKLDTRTDTKGRKQPAKKQTQPKKSTSSDSSRSGVSQISTAPEKLTSGLPRGSDSPKTPTEQSTVVETQTQPNPIVRAWIAATKEERRQFAKEWSDDIGRCLRSNRSENDPLRFQLWNCCFMIEIYLEDGGGTEEQAAEYQSLGEQLLALEQEIDDAEAAEEEGDDAEEDPPDDGIPDYLKRAAP